MGLSSTGMACRSRWRHQQPTVSGRASHMSALALAFPHVGKALLTAAGMAAQEEAAHRG